MRKYIRKLGIFGVIIFNGYNLDAQAESDFFDDNEFDFEFELYESDVVQNERWNDINGRNSLNSSSSGQTNTQDQNVFSEGNDVPTSVRGSGQLNPIGGMLNGLQGNQLDEENLSGLMLEGVSSGLGMDSLMSQLNPLSGLGLEDLQQNTDMMNEVVNDVDENNAAEEYKYYKASDVENLFGVMSSQLPEPSMSPVSIEGLLSGYSNEIAGETGLLLEDNFEKALEEEFALTPYEWRIDFTGILMSYEDVHEADEGEDPWNVVIREEGLIDFWAFIKLSDKLKNYAETAEIISTLEEHYAEYQDDVAARVAELEGKEIASEISVD